MRAWAGLILLIAGETFEDVLPASLALFGAGLFIVRDHRADAPYDGDEDADDHFSDVGVVGEDGEEGGQG